MKKALYLRPDAIRGTNFDEAVKEWLRTQVVEPVDEGEHDCVIYLPYCGGGCHYNAEVSPAMADAITTAISNGVDVERITVEAVNTVSEYDNVGGRYCRHLSDVELRWGDSHYGGNQCLSIMAPDVVEWNEEHIRVDAVLGYHELGHDWRT